MSLQRGVLVGVTTAAVPFGGSGSSGFISYIGTSSMCTCANSPVTEASHFSTGKLPSGSVCTKVYVVKTRTCMSFGIRLAILASKNASQSRALPNKYATGPNTLHIGLRAWYPISGTRWIYYLICAYTTHTKCRGHFSIYGVQLDIPSEILWGFHCPR